jgi:hypothetical protein
VHKKDEKPVGRRVLARVLAEELKRVHGTDETGDVVVTAPNPRRDITQLSQGDVPAN